MGNQRLNQAITIQGIALGRYDSGKARRATEIAGTEHPTGIPSPKFEKSLQPLRNCGLLGPISAGHSTFTHAHYLSQLRRRIRGAGPFGPARSCDQMRPLRSSVGSGRRRGSAGPTAACPRTRGTGEAGCSGVSAADRPDRDGPSECAGGEAAYELGPPPRMGRIDPAAGLRGRGTFRRTDRRDDGMAAEPTPLRLVWACHRTESAASSARTKTGGRGTWQ